MSRTQRWLCLSLLSLFFIGHTGFTAPGNNTQNNATPHSATSRGLLQAPASNSGPCQATLLPTDPPSLNPGIPCAPNIPGADFANIKTAQDGFDVYSWRTFIALNWPQDGKALGTDNDNRTVWETYKESYQVFRPDGKDPRTNPVDVPKACADLGGNATTVVRMIQKVSTEVLDESQQPFKTGPLIDQRGQYARYAISLNDEAFEYIATNNLYSKAGQKKFGPANFPGGDNAKPALGEGAIVIKSAWRVLDQARGDLPGRYHTMTAFVYTAPTTQPKVAEKCEVKDLGLVGFHVMHKTTHAPQWIWSTFEQVDNLRMKPVPSASGSPAAGAPSTLPAGLKPSFFNPACKTCRVNKPPPKPWNPNVPAPPSQITRLIPIDKPTESLNAQWQAFLRSVNRNTVWQYYELISTQWPTNAKGSPAGNPAPQFLGNSTMETYLQGRVPNVSSSCIMCHLNATTTSGKFGDFSYLLQRAR
jgi:hypothetical protein